MPSPRKKFIVRIHEGEYQQICQWTLKKKTIETGGDLFGLWYDCNTPVVQLVLGPGKEVRRSGVSFYQDLGYLEEVGSHLTQDQGICHIGEWHSHHQLGLARPSGGDEGTVWRNMPLYGLTRFFICISNISKDFEGNYTTSVGCFLFEIDPVTRERLPVQDGVFEILSENSPFRVEFHGNLKHGAENTNTIMTEDQRCTYLQGIHKQSNQVRSILYSDDEDEHNGSETYEASDSDEDRPVRYTYLGYLWTMLIWGNLLVWRNLRKLVNMVCVKVAALWNRVMFYFYW